MKPSNLTGEVFNKLTVIKRVGNSPAGQTRWLCKCECGGVSTVLALNLKRGTTTSCGCVGNRALADRTRTHGMTGTSEHNIWRSMVGRCTHPTHTSYPRYGGVGVSVCHAWRGSFERFYRDMGPRPSTEHSIDRRDNNAGYSPDNCYWATRKEQAANTSRVHRHITYQGITMDVKGWVDRLGITTVTTVNRRIKSGWSEIDAITTKPRCKPHN